MNLDEIDQTLYNEGRCREDCVPGRCAEGCNCGTGWIRDSEFKSAGSSLVDGIAQDDIDEISASSPGVFSLQKPDSETNREGWLKNFARDLEAQLSKDTEEESRHNEVSPFGSISENTALDLSNPPTIVEPSEISTREKEAEDNMKPPNQTNQSGSCSGEKVVNSKRKSRGPVLLQGERKKNRSLTALTSKEKKNYSWAPPKKFNDKIYRLIASDMKEDMQYIIKKIFPNLSKEHWAPVRSDILKIQTKLGNIETEIAQMIEQGQNEEEIKDVVVNRLKEVEKMFQQVDVKRKQGTTANEITNEMKTRLEKVVVAIDEWKRVGQILCNSTETATFGSTGADQGQGNGQTPNHSEMNYITEDVLEHGNKLFSNNKRLVKFSDFPSLEDEIGKMPKGDIPEYLQDVASIIKKDWGITKANIETHHYILLRVYAAVHEMKNHVGIKQLKWDTLSKWGATCNMAKDVGLPVKFFEDHLMYILKGFLAFRKCGGPRERVQKLEDELKVIKECVSAQKSFEGNCLSCGLFPQ